MELKCAYSFCKKTFRSERGRNAHYKSEEGKYHNAGERQGLKRKFSLLDDSKCPSEDEESSDLPVSEAESLIDFTGGNNDKDQDFLAESPLLLDGSSEDSHLSGVSTSTIYVEEYPGAAEILGEGLNIWEQRLEEDKYSENRKVARWYPFAGEAEWKTAEWLNAAPLSMQDIDSFLKLDFVSLQVTGRRHYSINCSAGTEARAFVLLSERAKAAYRPTSRYSSLEIY